MLEGYCRAIVSKVKNYSTNQSVIFDYTIEITTLVPYFWRDWYLWADYGQATALPAEYYLPDQFSQADYQTGIVQSAWSFWIDQYSSIYYHSDAVFLAQD